MPNALAISKKQPVVIKGATCALIGCILDVQWLTAGIYTAPRQSH